MKSNSRYGEDPNNLARRSIDDLMAGFTEILVGCQSLLRPGGFLVITARPFRRAGRMVDIPTLAAEAALNAGYVPHERCVALLAAARDDGLMARTSFFQLVNARNAFAAGSPTHVCAHEEVIVFRRGADEADEQCGCVPFARRLSDEGRAA